MKSKKFSTIMVVFCAALGLAACTHRDAPPLTPSENTATPTYRSTTNSYELDSSPKYTQSGVNGGEPATLPSIPSPERFSQNSPLAFAVYGALHTDPKIDARYISVFSKGSTIELLGTAHSSDMATVIKDVKGVSGVKVIENKLGIK
jgi:hypothetical protein